MCTIDTLFCWDRLRVRKIAYEFGGPSEKNVSLINFLLQNTNLVSVLSKICPKFCWSCLTGLTHFTNSAILKCVYRSCSHDVLLQKVLRVKD